MARKPNVFPSYLLHQPTGQARVRIKGQDYYLGQYGSDESRIRYGGLIAKLAGGVPIDPVADSNRGSLPRNESDDPGPSVGELCLVFLRHAETHYVKNGKQTSEVHILKSVISPLNTLYGMLPAKDFGPLALKAVRVRMIELGWCRDTVNAGMSRIRRIFKHAIANELIDGSLLLRLQCVAPLLAGRTEAHDNAPRTAVDADSIAAVKKLVSTLIGDLIELQRLTGSRSGELIKLTTGAIDRTGDVWAAQLGDHKAVHHGKSRTLYFGPQAQLILTKYLSADPDERIFKITRSRQHLESFRHHSQQCAQVLAITEDLKARDFRTLADVDYFELIDRKVLSDLAKEVEDRKISAGQCVQFVRNRRSSHWYDNYRHHYAAIESAASFLEAINSATLEMDSFDDGIRRYTQSWWQVDSLYRQFVFHSRESNSTTLFEGLSQLVEQHYSNRFLLPLGDRWQGIVDQSEKWAPPSAQKDFFLTKVQTPFLAKSKKVCVIISDGLRYEIGHEFAERIRRENRYSAAISHMVTGLPSYTQLGMAALLPNKKLQISLDDSATVSVDGASSAGTENRKTILGTVPGKNGTAIQARDLLAMNAGDSRTLFRDHDFVYVYHNVIDITGDKAATERDVFHAADQTIEDLVQLVKKLTAARSLAPKSWSF